MAANGQPKRSQRAINAKRPGDEERWSASSQAGPKVTLVVDERRNVMRNLPDPKAFPGATTGGMMLLVCCF